MMLSHIFSPVNIVIMLALSVAVSSNPTLVFRNRRVGDVVPRSFAGHRPLKQFDIRNHKKRIMAETVSKPQTSPRPKSELPIPVTEKASTSSQGSSQELSRLQQAGDSGVSIPDNVGRNLLPDSEGPGVQIKGNSMATTTGSNAVTSFADRINSAFESLSFGRRSKISDLMSKLGGPAVSAKSPGSEPNGEKLIQGKAGVTQDSTATPANGDVMVAPPSVDHYALITTADKDSTGSDS